MIKLTRQTQAHRTILRVEGRLDASTLSAFEGVLDEEVPARIELDLSGLTSIDEAGRGFLIALRETGCRLHAGSLYITRLLERSEP